MQLGMGGVIKRVVKMVSFLLYGQPFLRYSPFLKSTHLAYVFWKVRILCTFSEKSASCVRFLKSPHLAYVFWKVHILRMFFFQNVYILRMFFFKTSTSCGCFFFKTSTSCGCFFFETSTSCGRFAKSPFKTPAWKAPTFPKVRIMRVCAHDAVIYFLRGFDSFSSASRGWALLWLGSSILEES